MYDFIIVGGGISGLYCARQLSDKYKVLILEKKDYLGGRIYTHRDPQYEIGAGRFNDSHKMVNELIDQYELTRIPISSRIDFVSSNSLKICPNVQKLVSKELKYVIKESKPIKKEKLQNITFKQLCELYYPSKTVEHLIAAFGYTANFRIINAYDGINMMKENYIDKKFYALKEGLSTLCKLIKKDIVEQGGEIKLDTDVIEIYKKSDYFDIKTKEGNIATRKIIFAIKPHQLQEIKYLEKYKPLLNSVATLPLLRVYAQYPKMRGKVWFEKLNKMTTNSFLRKIIPINPDAGIIMISYTDGSDVEEFLNKQKLISDKKLINKIQSEIKRLFPSLDIPEPIFMTGYYWDAGKHFWKKGANSDTISRKILNPEKNLYICGEGLSQHQAWMEGALITSKKVIEIISET